MLWYLLYPFPRRDRSLQLPQSHPLRRAFYRLGYLLARHWLVSIALSVAAAVALCYPSIFLYKTPAAGYNKVPHHVWASAHMSDGGLEGQSDVEVRQVWIHGTYMRALERHVLLEALDIQNRLIQGGLEVSGKGGTPRIDASRDKLAGLVPCGYSPAEPLSWGLHSPLMYWNCTTANVGGDKDPIGTINAQTQRKSYLGLTLKPTSIFAGKSFDQQRLTAADALVVTMFALKGSEAGSKWDQRIQALVQDTQGGRQWYLPDASSHVYEFEFKSMSLRDGLGLWLCYAAMIAYVLVSLRKTRAVKSTLGLGATIIIELTVSIVASFTICGMLNIDLTRIPQEAYPFVVLTIGLENMFRLMNAVVATPATLPTTQRIASAMGEVGHLSLIVAAQNLFFLFVLSFLVAPSVQAFCAFAAIALVVDFFLHLTFFVAVLSVDVQRLELQDSLDRVNLSSKRAKSPRRPERHTWIEALRHGKLPFSTRVAGTAVTVSFVIVLNWHFLDKLSLLQMLLFMTFGRHQDTGAFLFAKPPPINQRRTPGAWLRMQDHQTAKEVIDFVKPSASGFSFRIFQPVIVVLDRSDRGVPSGRTERIIASIHALLDQHLVSFVLTVVTIVALTTILMNYLLWNELSEEDEYANGEGEEDVFNVTRLWRSHEHDIIKVFSDGRNLVTVSSDRALVTYIWDAKQSAYNATTVQYEDSIQNLWPVASVALHDSGSGLAVFAKDGRVGFCMPSDRHFRHVVDTPLRDRTAILSTFMSAPGTDGKAFQYLLLTSDGSFTAFTAGQQVSMTSSKLFDRAPTYAVVVSSGKGQLRICVLLKDGTVRIVSRRSNDWHTLTSIAGEAANGHLYIGHPKAMTRAAHLQCIVLSGDSMVQLLNDATGDLIATINGPYRIKKGSLQVLQSPRRECPRCRGPATHSLVFVFTDADTEDFVMLTYKLSSDSSVMLCFSPADIRAQVDCRSLENVKPTTQTVERPGSWDATSLQAVIGIRMAATPDSDGEESESDVAITTSLASNSVSSTRSVAVRERRQARPTARSRTRLRGQILHDDAVDPLTPWEIWTLSPGGDLETRPLTSDLVRQFPSPLGGQHEHERLYAASVGPVRRLGKRSVAITLANTVYIVALGTEGRFQDSGADDLSPPRDIGARSSRRDRESVG